MPQFDEGNRLLKFSKLGNHPFDHARFSKRIDETIALFSQSFLERFCDVGLLDDLPIFVVGMMRSGTTLLEQILTCHEHIGGAGEQSFWTHTQPALVDLDAGLVNLEEVGDAGERYCSILRSMVPNRRFVVDKNPANFFALGLIRLALPKGKVIHIRRDPIDTCLSMYVTPVRNPPEFGCDASNIVYAYREYQRLMDHWRSVIAPTSFLEIDYEDLVDNMSDVTKLLIEFIGLNWDEKCLHPEANVRTVRTPSFWQVRQPLYRTSVGRSKRYKALLGEFGQLAK
jgi:hypothetical protein